MGEQLGRLLGYLFTNDISVLPIEQQRIFIDTLIDENYSTPYEYVSKYVYEQEDISMEDNEIFNQNQVVLLREIQYSNAYKENDTECLKKNLNKLSRHYALAKIQKEFILNTTKDVEKKVVNFNKSISELDKSIARTKEAVSNVETTKSSIYTDMIAILGVFSAFVLVMFGGIEIARSLFDIGDDLSNMKLSRIITVVSIMMIIVLTILYSLLLWIAKITGKNFTKCYSKECKEGCTRIVKHIFYRHAYYIILMILLVLSASVSHKFF